MILSYRGIRPQLAGSVFVAPTATIIGDVHVGDDSSIWFGVVLRGDVNLIRVGRRTNIQDGSIVHVTGQTHPTIIGDDVTVGHGVKLHGCTVGDGALIGIGAIVLDGAVIGEGSMVAAGSLVTPGTVAPPHSLLVGSPARVKRTLDAVEVARLKDLSVRYMAYGQEYRQAAHQLVDLTRPE